MEKEKEAPEMSAEIAHAVDFYANHLATLPKPPSLTEKEKESKEKESLNPLTELDAMTIEAFREELSKLLQEKFTGHWYPEDKLRGSGFRSISYDARMDTMLLKAAQKAMIDRLPERLENARYYIMFINPGEVKLKNTRLHTSEAKYLWRLGGIIEEEDASSDTPSSPTLTVDLKSETKLKGSSSFSSPSLSPSSPPSDESSPRYLSPGRISRLPTEFKDRSTQIPLSITPTTPLSRKSSTSMDLPPFSSELSPTPVRSPSPPPPPLPMDQYIQQGAAFPHPQTFLSSNFRGRETVSEPYVHGPIPYNLPRRNGGNGPAFLYAPNKYTFTAPRSRTPSPPLLVGTAPTPQINGFFRSHTSPARPPSSILHQNHHELPRVLHPPDYARFAPRYRSMVHTRS